MLIKETLNIISVRKNPEYRDKAIAYFQQSWPSVFPMIYQDCITHCIAAKNPLPQWYLLEKNGEIIGCAGLITNDFISRVDLYPWVCAVFIAESHRGNAYGNLLLEQAKLDAQEAGFDNLYLSTSHIGLYEKYGVEYLGQGYHPWEEESRIYEIALC
jgi:GNAT superfamily N-acetyltransferase